MQKIINKLKRDHYLLALFFVLIIATFLRFYQFEGFITYLGDQGRDAIVLKRILMFQHFPAIGAPTSIGQVYLGPFYYYFIAPWLAFSFLNPIGPAIGDAVFSILFIAITYFIVSDLLNKKVALLSSIFLTFSEILIEFSRFSWNPNLLPLFSLLTFYLFIKSLQKNKYRYYFLTGMFLSVSIQLHYLALLLIIPIGILMLVKLFQKRQKETFLQTGIMGIAFILFLSPLIFFDLKHQFLNSKNFIKLFSSSSVHTSFMDKIHNFGDSQLHLFQYSFHIQNSTVLLFLSILFLFVFIFALVKEKNIKKENIRYFYFFFVFILIGISLYNGPRYPHYLGILYPFFYIILAYFLVFFLKKWQYILPFIMVYIISNALGYYFFINSPNHQIEAAEGIAKVIADNVTTKRYNVTSLPYMYSDATYRYFLEIWNKRPIEKDIKERGDELFVICEEACKPIGDPQWDIAYFAPNKVLHTWKVDNVTIYKLIR